MTTTIKWNCREWSDEYPDTFSVHIQISAGRAFVVVSGQAVWLTSQQVAEVILHLAECKVEVDKYNKDRSLLSQAQQYVAEWEAMTDVERQERDEALAQAIRESEEAE